MRKGPWERTLPGLTKMLLDSVQDVHAVLAVNHVHCQAPLAKAAGAPDPVQIGLIVRVPVLVHGKVKVDDDRHLFDIDACVKESCGGVRMGERNHCHPVEPHTPTSGGRRRLSGPALGFRDKWHVAEPRGKPQSAGRR